jgi:hypothetical protein
LRRHLRLGGHLVENCPDSLTSARARAKQWRGGSENDTKESLEHKESAGLFLFVRMGDKEVGDGGSELIDGFAIDVVVVLVRLTFFGAVGGIDDADAVL